MGSNVQLPLLIHKEICISVHTFLPDAAVLFLLWVSPGAATWGHVRFSHSCPHHPYAQSCSIWGDSWTWSSQVPLDELWNMYIYVCYTYIWICIFTYMYNIICIHVYNTHVCIFHNLYIICICSYWNKKNRVLFLAWNIGQIDISYPLKLK